MKALLIALVVTLTGTVPASGATSTPGPIYLECELGNGNAIYGFKTIPPTIVDAIRPSFPFSTIRVSEEEI